MHYLLSIGHTVNVSESRSAKSVFRKGEAIPGVAALVHRLLNPLGSVAFKMGRLQKESVLNASISLDAPERQVVDFCSLRALFDLCWDCTLWVALTADRERRARLGVNDGDHLPSKIAKKLVIGLIPVCRQLTQFFEFGLWQFNNNVKPNIRLTRPDKVASGVNVSGGHIQGRLFGVGVEIQRASVRPK